MEIRGSKPVKRVPFHCIARGEVFVSCDDDEFCPQMRIEGADGVNCVQLDNGIAGLMEDLDMCERVSAALVIE